MPMRQGFQRSNLHLLWSRVEGEAARYYPTARNLSPVLSTGTMLSLPVARAR